MPVNGKMPRRDQAEDLPVLLRNRRSTLTVGDHCPPIYPENE
jgi:hypothetical protein